MKGQPGGGKTKGLGDLPGGQTRLTFGHEQTHQVETRLVRKGREGRKNLLSVHFTSPYPSTIQEQLK